MYDFSAVDDASDRILMTAVDTGWITDERPHPTKLRLAEGGLKQKWSCRMVRFQLVTQGEVARVLGLRVVAASMKGGAPPTTESSEYKLYATELSRRLADASMDIAMNANGAAFDLSVAIGHIRVGKDAPLFSETRL